MRDSSPLCAWPRAFTQSGAPIELLAKNTGTALRSLFVSTHKGISDQTLVIIAGAMQLRLARCNLPSGILPIDLGRLPVPPLHCKRCLRAGGGPARPSPAEACPELVELDLSMCRGMTDNGLGRLADACGKLRRLHLWGCRQVTDRFISGTVNEGLQILGQD